MIDAVLDAPVAGRQLLDRIHSAFEASPYVPSDRMRIEEIQGSVRLVGRVTSYFEKQMAQEVLRRVDGVERIENLLEVNWA
jgi:osmotically-inducible protein OsmY